MVREAIANIAQATFFDILLDRIEWLLLAYFHLCVGPPGNLDNHVQDTIALIGKERDIVEWRHN